MLDWLKNMFGAKAQEAQALQPAGASAAAPQASGNENQAPDWVGAANLILAQAMKRLPVKRYGTQGAACIMPVESVNLGGTKPESGGFIRVGGSAANETAVLTLNMKDKVGNYDIDAINNAVHAVLGSIPALSGKVKFAKDLSAQALDHEDIWKQLKVVVAQSGKFSAHEISTIGEYFEQSKQASAEDTDWGRITVDHADGKVQVRLRPQALKGDESSPVSGEAKVVNYFNEHKDTILKHMREKVAAFNVLTPDELASLDFTSAIMKADWGDQPTVEFGTRAAGGDAALGKTALAKIDTDKIQECFTAALLESSKELSPVFGRIADGAMVAQAIRQRVGESPAINAALDHDMFKSNKEQKADREKREKLNLVEIGNAVEGDEPQKLTLSFSLPHGVSLSALRESIVQGQQQIPILSARTLAQGSPSMAA